MSNRRIQERRRKPRAIKPVTPDIVQRWRQTLPEIEQVNESFSLALQDSTIERIGKVPAWWKKRIRQMKTNVHAQALVEPDDPRSITEHRSDHWGWEIFHLRDMINYLLREICIDLEAPEGGRLASMILVERALGTLFIELQSQGSLNGRDDEEENAYRVHRALQALSPDFDDIHLRRFRALDVAEFAARVTLPVFTERTPEEDEMFEGGPIPDDIREMWTYRNPVINGVSVKGMLCRIDPAFQHLDPLVVFEEFSEAEPSSGGRTTGGDARVGPARALARLCIMCGALEATQHDDENFDQAVERFRNTLHVSRSRIRNNFPHLNKTDIHPTPTATASESGSPPKREC
jgi:hypothetical protein